MKNIITEMKNTLERINSKLDEAEDRIREDKVVDNNQSEQQKEYKIMGQFKCPLDHIKQTNICIMEVLEREERARN